MIIQNATQDVDGGEGDDGELLLVELDSVVFQLRSVVFTQDNQDQTTFRRRKITCRQFSR